MYFEKLLILTSESKNNQSKDTMSLKDYHQISTDNPYLI